MVRNLHVSCARRCVALTGSSRHSLAAIIEVRDNFATAPIDGHPVQIQALSGTDSVGYFRPHSTITRTVPTGLLLLSATVLFMHQVSSA